MEADEDLLPERLRRVLDPSIQLGESVTLIARVGGPSSSLPPLHLDALTDEAAECAM